jgi:hypothetical protein
VSAAVERQAESEAFAWWSVAQQPSSNWPQPPPVSQLVIFSPAFTTWLEQNAQAQDSALDQLNSTVHQIQAVVASTLPTDLKTQLSAIQIEMPALTSAVEQTHAQLAVMTTALQELKTSIDELSVQIGPLAGAVRLVIDVNGKMTSGVPTSVPDGAAFFAMVTAQDAVGRVTPDANPFTWVVTDTNGNAKSSLATVSADPSFPNDTSHVRVMPAAPVNGKQEDFMLLVSDGTLTARSDVLVPTPGTPVQLQIQVAPQ